MAAYNDEIYDCAMSITFGDNAENHVGMEHIQGSGPGANTITSGFSYEDFTKIKGKVETLCLEKNILGVSVEIIPLHPALVNSNITEIPEKLGAWVMIIRNGVNLFKPENYVENFDQALYLEHSKLKVDKKLWNARQKKVQNKHARYNLCYGYFSQVADFNNGKGTVVNFDDVPCLNNILSGLNELCEFEEGALVAELNKYYDVGKCGIGPHGDKERLLVICIRLGIQIPLAYHWYHRHQPVGEQINIELNHGDIYFMSSKAVGKDWMKSSIYTLRHAAGCPKHVNFSGTQKKNGPKCPAILKSGKNKGSECGKNAKFGDYCGRHKSLNV